MTDLVRFTAIAGGLHTGMVVLGVIFLVLMVMLVSSLSKQAKKRCMNFACITAAVWFIMLVSSIFVTGHIEELRQKEDIITAEEFTDDAEMLAVIERAQEEFKELQAKKERLKAYTASKGKWEDAIDKPVVKTEKWGHMDELTSKHHDVDGDGIADFEIVYKGGKPEMWRGLDENGDSYG